jgi:hypothetical protein
MIGYAAATAEGRLEALTVGALTGALGLASSDGVTYHPAFYAAQGLSAMGGHLRYRCRSSRPEAIAAAAGTDRDGKRVAWIANLTGRNQVISLAGDMVISQIHVLDEESFAKARAVPAEVSSIELRPYALACLV